MIRPVVCAVLAALAGLVPVSVVQAGKVKVWHHSNQDDFSDADLQNAVISSNGVIRLSRQLESLAAIDATHVWDVIEDKTGNLFVATGTDGKLFKLSGDGKLTVAYKSTDGQILSLALAGDGSVFAGTGPSGTLVRIDAKGKADVIATGLDSYNWTHVFDTSSYHLYAGTGPKGRIFRVDPKGKSSIFYQTKQNHIMSLASGPKGTLYAGTDQGGLVYRIDPSGKGFVLYDAKQDEVRSLLVTKAGIYAGTSSPVKNSMTRVDRTQHSHFLAMLPSDEPVSDLPRLLADLVLAAPAPSSPKSGENSVYHIQPDGTAREIFRAKSMVLSMVMQKGRLLVGTGMKGQLFEIDPEDKEQTELARINHGQIHCLLRRRKGSIVVGTGDPGKLYTLKNDFANEGTVTSKVLDANIISRWGALRWKAITPDGTWVSVATRIGNVSEPDKTWSDWSDEATTASTAQVTSSAARFLQYRITLKTSKPSLTPEVSSLTVRYLNANQAPEITKLKVPNLDGEDLDDPRVLPIKWSAVDPNEDDLEYRVFVRKDNWKGWVLVKDGLDSTSYSWKTQGFPSGFYRVKVDASDRKDNDPKKALTASRTSGIVPIAHVPPAVKLTYKGLEGGRAILEAQATDRMVRLTKASFAVNGEAWLNVFPSDGLFDTKSENFLIRTKPLTPGTYVVVLRVQDAAGNVGSGDAVFTVEE